MIRGVFPKIWEEDVEIMRIEDSKGVIFASQRLIL